jgi:hypothetical protein
MMKKIIQLVLICSLLIQCDDANTGSQLEGKTFRHLLFSSEEVCRELQESGVLVNCYQIVWFQDKGKMEIVFTDILTRGKYTQLGKKIMIELEYGLESPKNFTFTKLSTGALRLDLNETVWVEADL